MFVYVRNRDGHSLMPCTPAKARKLLRAGRASVVKRCPFTIQLSWQCEGCVQEVRAGIDKGSHITGICCVGNGKALFSAEIHHRKDVKDRMDDRRVRRRARRSRKWYRPARCNNRASSRRSGRLPPSIKTNVEEVIRVVRKIPLPIAQHIIEDVQVDIARLNNPTLHGSQYQDPTRLGENLRIACLMRDRYTCQHCGKRNCRLEAHHVVFRERGGKDTLANLLCLCEDCHHRLHEGKIQLQVTGVSGHLDQIAQRSMQGKSYLYAIRFRPRQTRKQFHSLPQMGKGRVRYQVYEELKGFKKGDIVLVKEKWVKQVNTIYAEGRLAFQRVKGEPANAKPEDCRLLEREQTIIWEKVS
jgi:5-methylcytosine-specific restriction endonuclease McrA